jgi:aspartyl-tRNA(Asn)/glutamyl-tRNA(Gln) amidotransferase subunit A
MTAASSTADEQFRKALAAIQAILLERDRAPAFVPPPVTPRAAPRGAGEIAGPDGDVWSAASALRAGETTVASLLAHSTQRIRDHAARLHAFEFVADIEAEAAELEREAAAGAWRGPLHGIPVSIKDIIDVRGMPTTGSSNALDPRVAAADATAVSRLRAAGAVIVGKTVTHEFALGVTTPQSRNPWDEARIPGGSSGGSAISVVTGMALASLGTDTRASIRVPPALSGAVGFRPTTGLVPADRWLTLSWSMDVLAPMSRSVRDIALIVDVLTVDGTLCRALPGSLAGVTAGVSDLFLAGIDPGVRQCFEAAIAAAERAGARVVRADALSADDVALANYTGMVLSRVEAAHFHEGLGTDLERCSPEVAAQLRQAGAVMGVDYVRCLRVRDRLCERFRAAFSGIDLLMLPTSKVVAPRLEEASEYLMVLSENCVPWSLVSFPAISLFAGMSGGLPAGVQLVAPSGHDAFLLGAAHALERQLPPLPEWTP